MNYYRYLPECNEEYYLSCVNDKIYNDFGFLFSFLTECKKIEKWDKRNTIFFERKRKVRDIVESPLPEPCVSERLKKLLEEKAEINKHREDIQFFPINIVNWNDPEDKIEGYYLMHILNLVENSVYEWHSEGYRKHGIPEYTGEVTFEKEKINGLQIFREKKAIKKRFFFSQAVKDIFDHDCDLEDYIAKYLEYYVK